MKQTKDHQEASYEHTYAAFGAFGKAILKLLNERGWNTVPRREMTLHLLHHAYMAGLIDLTAPRMQLAAKLKVSPATLDGLLRDRALVCTNVQAMDFQGFAKWAKNNNQTGYDDAQKGILTFSVQSLKQGMQVEGFLDSIDVVPDYRNNRRLLTIDLSRLVAAISRNSRQSAADLFRQVAEENEEFKNLNIQADGSEKKLLHEFLQALLEQGNKRIGGKTVSFMISLVEKGTGWVTKNG